MIPGDQGGGGYPYQLVNMAGGVGHPPQVLHCGNGFSRVMRHPNHGENALMLHWECRTCRGPFGFAQGRLFDYVAASLREAATPLRMTFQVRRYSPSQA